MSTFTVTTGELTTCADRLAEAADTTSTLLLGATLGSMYKAMSGSRSSLAAGLARTAWIDHTTAWTTAARAQADSLRACALTYAQTDSDAQTSLSPGSVG